MSVKGRKCLPRGISLTGIHRMDSMLLSRSMVELLESQGRLVVEKITKNGTRFYTEESVADALEYLRTEFGRQTSLDNSVICR